MNAIICNLVDTLFYVMHFFKTSKMIAGFDKILSKVFITFVLNVNK